MSRRRLLLWLLLRLAAVVKVDEYRVHAAVEQKIVVSVVAIEGTNRCTNN